MKSRASLGRQNFVGLSVSLLLSMLMTWSANSYAEGNGGWDPDYSCNCAGPDVFRNGGLQPSIPSIESLAVDACQSEGHDMCELGGGNCVESTEFFPREGTLVEAQTCLQADSSHSWPKTYKSLNPGALTRAACPRGHDIDSQETDCIETDKTNALDTSVKSPLECTETNPCNPADGNKSQTEVDYAASADGGLRFARYYNSNGSYKTGQGMHPGWRHTYSRGLDEEPDREPTMNFAAPAGQSSFYTTASDACTTGWNDLKGTVWSGELATATATFSGGNTCKISSGGSPVAYFPVRSGVGWTGFTPGSTIKTVTRANGASYTFELDGSNWVNHLNPALTLEASGNQWIFTDKNDTQETFDANGKLISITRRNGQTETLEYNLTAGQGGDGNSSTLDRVTGPFGHTISFGYGASGHLSTVTTPDGTIQYALGSNDNLESVTYADTSTRQYVFDKQYMPHHLTGIIDENGDRFATWDYDDAGRAILSEHAGGKEQVQLAFNANGTTTLTMANGASRTYTFATVQGERRVASLTGDVCSTCPGGNTKDRDYDSNGFIAERTDWENNVTKTARNALGLVETLTEAFGTSEQRVTTTLWHANYRLPTKVTSPRNVTDYTYDANGNVLTVTISGGGKTRAWTFTYNANGQPLTIDGPRTAVTDVTTFAYYACTTGNECGQLQSVTNALGHVTDYDSYDSAGRLTKMTDPNGLETSFSYDNRGRLLTTTQTPTSGAARVTTMTYDSAGQVATMTLPDGMVLTYAYSDAHYLTSVTDNVGNSIAYSYDSMGNQTDEDTFDPGSTLKRALDYAHDLNYRLDTVTDGGFTTDLTFDLVGNLTNEQDPNDNTTQHTYDALNRLDNTVDALTGVIDYSYDDHDNLTQVAAPNGATTNYVYDNLDNLLSETSPDRGLTTYTYDDAGNRLTATDARGKTATYAYDALNRLTSVSYPDTTENVTYGYDVVASSGIGRLTSISDQSGTTSYSYDAFGSVASDSRQIAGVTYTVSYQYDAVGNVSSITYPSGRTVDYGRNSIGQVTQVTSTKSGTVKNIVTSASYEPFGPLKSLTYGNGQVFDYAHRTDYRVTDIDSVGIADKSYGYDPAGNITSIGDAIDTSLSRDYEYDALHRLTFENSAGSVPYADKVIADGTIGYWRLGEASGTAAVDASGSAGNGTYSGGTTLGEPGLVAGTDTAMRSNSVGAGYVLGPVLTGTTVTGVEAWFQTDSVVDNRHIVSLYDPYGTRFGIAQTTDGRIYVYQGVYIYIWSDAAVSINEPHHIAAWYEAGSTYLMIDGVIQQGTYGGNLLGAYNPEVLIGASKYQGVLNNQYLGELDEVAIYDSPVSAAMFLDHSQGSVADVDLGYDANGNRTTHDNGVTVTNYGYDSFSNRLNSIGGSTIQLDAAGNLISDSGGVRTFSYDDTGRLSEILENSVSTATYVHNAMGQRTKKTVGSTSTIYLYDLNGTLLAEHDDTGALIRDYVTMNGVHVAQIDQGEAFAYLHNDHLGTPRLATNDSQVVIWRWDSDAFGSTLPDEDPDGDTIATTVNLRFPGQYYDAESGLHYNYYRTYDPSTGRYLESDPIGLDGGLNTYGYVYQSPLKYVDSLGLDADCVCKATGAVGGGGGLVNGVQPNKVCRYKCICTEIGCDGNSVGEPKSFSVDASSSAFERTDIDISKRCIGQMNIPEIMAEQKRDPLTRLDIFKQFGFQTGNLRHSQETLDAYERIGMEPPDLSNQVHAICQLSPELCSKVDAQF